MFQILLFAYIINSRLNFLYDKSLTVFTAPHIIYSLFINVIYIGGFGIVRTAVKRTGRDKGRSFAVKTISKSAVLLRNSGLSTVS
jgi:hypothetical protein